MSEKLLILPKIHNKRSVIEINNLCDCFKDLIENESSGVFYPQDKEYMDTTEVMANHRVSLGKKAHQSVLFALLVRCLSLFIGTFKRMYSSKIYK